MTRSPRPIRPTLLCLSLLLLALLPACAGGPAHPDADPEAWDQARVELREYYFGFLHRGSRFHGLDEAEARRIADAHTAHIEEGQRSGLLIFAGPFRVDAGAPEGTIAGMLLFEPKRRDEVDAFLAEDPALREGVFTCTLRVWIGPSGLTFRGRQGMLDGRPETRATGG